MKTQKYFLSFILLFQVFDFNAQTINIHSIQAARQISPAFAQGYTLDGDRMIFSRLKLLNTSNFGLDGTYPKSIQITDSYFETGSLSAVSTLPKDNIFYFGMFAKPDQVTQLNDFTTSELTTLYNWSLSGGKMIIAAGISVNSFNFDILNLVWGFSINFKVPSFLIATNEGLGTDIFSGPFGNIPEAFQGGSAQGFFSSIPLDSKIFAIDINGSPTLYMDCNTLDLIIVDVDGYTDLGGISASGLGIINNNQDKFWANSIVFMDKLQPLPTIVQENNTLAVTPVYVEYQWYFNSSPIVGANEPSFTITESGNYQVEVTFYGGCKKMTNSTNFILSTNDVLSENTVRFYPNPANDKINIVNTTDLSDDFDLEIYSMTGKLLVEAKIERKDLHIFDISDLPTGIYLIKFKIKNGVINKKLIKN